MKPILTIVLALLAGVLLLAAYRFAFVPLPSPPHYHANFAIFVAGERVDLSADRYMEEVAACHAGASILPRQRAHLHENVPDVAHVHHEGVTWGHLMANLGLGLGKGYLALDDGRVLTAGEGRTLKLVLNERPQFEVHNQLIRSGDRLLVSFGPGSEADAIREQLPQVPATAEEYNRKQDPASCAGAHEATLGDRLRHAFLGG